MNMTKELSESLLAACKAAGIEKPRYIAQDEDGEVWSCESKPRKGQTLWDGCVTRMLHHPPYAEDWKESLLEWVEPQSEPLADVLAQHGDLVGDDTEMVILYDIADTSKMIDDACEIAYHAHLENGNGFRWSRLDCYRAAWQDALAWKGGGDQARGIEAMVCKDIAKRQQVGIAKYGTTVAENPLTHAEWLQHAYEECLDMAVYLKRAMTEKGGSDD
jgi:hypothetical protein